MTFFVYMLICEESSKKITYVGYTKNLSNRLRLHNNSKGAKFTKGRNWNLIYKKKFKNKSSAIKFEYYLKKNYNLRKKIKSNYIFKIKSNEIFKD